jgi:hypothetical protein
VFSDLFTERAKYEDAYPGLRYLPSSRNWWAKLKGVPAECEHLDQEVDWIASLVPDTLYLRGKAAVRREPVRPEVMMCRDCFLEVLQRELANYDGKVTAFEPDSSAFTQFFFVGPEDFQGAGLLPDLQTSLNARLSRAMGTCELCSTPATWQWFPHASVPDLGDTEAVAAVPGVRLCRPHGIRRLLDCFEKMPEANIYYVNLPYGDSGVYLWI